MNKKRTRKNRKFKKQVISQSENFQKKTDLFENRQKEARKNIEGRLKQFEEETDKQIEKQNLKFSKIKLGVIKEIEELVKDVALTTNKLIEDFKNSTLKFEKNYNENLNKQNIKISNSLEELEKNTNEKMETLNLILKDLFSNTSYIKNSLKQIEDRQKKIMTLVRKTQGKHLELKEKFENMEVSIDMSNIKQFIHTMSRYEKKTPLNDLYIKN